MNYLIARVSDPEQRKALPAQKKKLYDYAERMKWAEKKDFKYIEFDETAFKEKRETFRALVIDPLTSERELSIAVFDKIDRFSRDSSSEDKNTLTKLFRNGRIELHFPSDNLYISKDSPAADLFRLDIGVALAGYYSASIRNNVNRRFSQMLKDGIWVGKAPIGYLNYQEHDIYGKAVKKGIKIDPVRSPLIQQAFELRSTGMPYKSIAKEMKKRGLRSNTKLQKPISTSQWEEILKNKFYIGIMTYIGKEYEHHYDMLIESWLWDKCQGVNEQRGKIHTKYNSKPYLFKNLRCHTCGYSISFDGPKGKGNNTYGKCTEYGGKHGAEWINEKTILQQVRDVLNSITLPKEELPYIIEEIEKNHASEQKQYIETKKRLEKEYDQLDEEVQELFADRKQFQSRPDIFEKMVKKIELKQKDILEVLQDHSDGDKAFVIGASYIVELCSRAVELFDAESTTIEQKRYLLNLILPNATLDGEKLVFTLKEPFGAVASMQKTQNWYPGQDSN